MERASLSLILFRFHTEAQYSKDLKSRIQNALEILLGNHGRGMLLSFKYFDLIVSLVLDLISPGVRSLGDEYCDITPIHNNTTLSRSRKVMASLLHHVIASISTLKPARQLNLALFYFQARYYTLAHRILGITYIRNFKSSANNSGENDGYQLLGVLLLIRVAIDLYHNLYKRLFPCMLIATYSVELDPVDSQASVTTTEKDGNATSFAGHAGPKCTLCLEVRSNDTLTSCGHVFCWTCIAEWCANKPECPLCRQAIKPSRFTLLTNL